MIPIYHITHLGNLPGIIKAKGLWCDSERLRQGWDSINIAHQNIKDRRSRRRVPVAAGGTLADYVPFYFAPLSPMLYAIHTGYVSKYNRGQREVLYLVSNIETAERTGCPFCFTDGHAEMEMSEFSDQLAELNNIVDWSVMGGRYWGDSADHPDRKRRRQAEFLVYKDYPWTAIHEIGVYDKAIAEQVLQQLPRVLHRPKVNIRINWYY
jgi:hypothetical protein